jgi:cell division cycle 20-like protein 1, cofactor of APC complex
MRRFPLVGEASLSSNLFSCDFDRQTSHASGALARDYRKILTKGSEEVLGLREVPEQAAEKKRGPIRVTRAVGIADDFYSNLIDWSGNTIAFALDDKIFLQNFLTGKGSLLHKLGTPVTSVKFCRTASILGVGTSVGEVCLVETSEGKIFGRRHQHKSRIGVLSWKNHTLLSGSRDRLIKHIDIYSPGSQRSITLHTQEICGISYDHSGSRIATGGNDNKVFVFDDRRYDRALHSITSHKAAVKAIDWSPERQGALVTGGGTADRTVKLWNVNGDVPELLESIDYGSQICNVRWTRKNELITTHGYSQNDVRIMNFGRRGKMKVFEGHKNRVLHFGISDDEEYFVTGSGDETICIWKTGESDLGRFMVR